MNIRLFNILKPESWIASLLIILVSIFTYGILVSQLGFYRDDWYMLWAAQAWGIAGIVGLFEGDRPFLGWVYAFDYTLLGYSPLAWHIYGLFLRIVTSLLFLWLLRLIWPEKRLETTLATLILTLYPGYFQQPNAATFNPTHLAYSAAIASLALNILTIRSKDRIKGTIYTISSVVLVAFYLFIYESLIGIEVFRVILITYLLWQDDSLIHLKTKVSLLIRSIWPYFFTAGLFVFWRIFLFQSIRRAVSLDVIFGQYGQSPAYSMVNLFFEFIKDFLEISVLAWFVPFYQFTIDGRLKDFLASIGIAVIVCGLVFVYWRWAEKFTESDESSFSQWVWLGILFIIVTTIPVIVAGRHVIFGIQWDRYTYQSIAGVALLIVGLAYAFLKPPIRIGFICGLLFLAVVTHYHSAAFYRDFWEYQRQTWIQLSWRAPDLAENTNIVAVLPRGYRLAEEYEIWGPANFVYSPSSPIKVSGQVLDSNLFYELVRGTKETRQMRNIPVFRDYTKTLIISLPGPGACLHVIDGDRPELSMREDAQLRLVASYSSLEQILTDASPHRAPSIVFGNENRQHWCYYYQKISLARQRADWNEAVRLSDEAVSLGLKPSDLVEWLPVYESYANARREKDAEQISHRIKSDIKLSISICLMYKNVDWPAGYNAEFIKETLCTR